ncbi:serine/threonine protein kinase [Paenibacillus sp. P26]|nr:serine/threonine protein kinase [Paenibacillus sp. P26]
MLRSEAETMSRLSHPNLPDIIDYVPPGADGFSYLVMDYIEGETLQERFERQGQRMTGEQVAEWALQLCGLLDYLHSLQPEPVIHRDLKPVNLMVGPDGRLRLIDFGTARSFKAGLHGDTVSIGTIGFAAPEQFAGRQSDTRTDLYGLGALMYYLLSGGEHYRPSANSRPAPPEGLGEIVLRLLRENPDERFQSAREAALAAAGLACGGCSAGTARPRAGARAAAARHRRRSAVPRRGGDVCRADARAPAPGPRHSARGRRAADVVGGALRLAVRGEERPARVPPLQ